LVGSAILQEQNKASQTKTHEKSGSGLIIKTPEHQLVTFESAV